MYYLDTIPIWLIVNVCMYVKILKEEDCIPIYLYIVEMYLYCMI